MKTLRIEIDPSYTIYLEEKGGLSNNQEEESPLLPLFLKALLKEENKRSVLIADENVPLTFVQGLESLLKKERIETRVFFLEAKESKKTRETKEILENFLLDHGYGRDTLLLALGGGITTDLVGFVASTYLRGVPFVSLPTTLLAMVDASLGGKTGVNTHHGKNLIGSFYQPKGVFIDLEVLKTLPKREWSNGVVEMIKHALLASPSLFQELQHLAKNKEFNQESLLNIVYQSLVIKKEIVEKDPTESHQREWLNAGHTIAHALEQRERYQLSHGEAVAIGLIVEMKLSVELGYVKQALLEELISLLKKLDLPLKTRAFQNKTLFLDQLRRDKKSKKRIPRFVLFNDLGSPRSHDQIYTFPVEEALLERVLDWAEETFR